MMSKLASSLKSMRNPRRYDRDSMLLLIIVFLCFAFLILSFTSKTINYRFNYKDHHDLQLQGMYNGDEKSSDVENEGDVARRNLRGRLGSSPPRCASKCDNCTPCRPVHVPVPPGTPVVAEYYPEAWRCKCGNRLYMP